jgi:hypothetical protein
MVIFGAQDQRDNPLTSHCFATFVKLKHDTGGPSEQALELHHINWFTRLGHETGVPHGLMIDGRLAKPEPGENRDTASALRAAKRHGLTVYRFGPYQIDESLYQRALRHIDLLEGRIPGQKVLYKQLDYGLREVDPIVALNCIHAVSDVVRKPSPCSTGLAFGREAALLNLNHLKPWVKDVSRAHPDVWGRVWAALWGSGPSPSVVLVDCSLQSSQAPALAAAKGEEHSASPSPEVGQSLPRGD